MAPWCMQGGCRKLSMVCLHNNAVVARGIRVNCLHCWTPEQHLSAIYSSVGTSLIYFLQQGLSSGRYSEHESDVRDHDDTMLDPSQVSIMQVSHKALEQCEDFVRRVWDAGWKVVHHNSLPKWLKDNDFLIKGHRPQLNSFRSCFKSVFRIHTETGNIWTHLLGLYDFWLDRDYKNELWLLKLELVMFYHALPLKYGAYLVILVLWSVWSTFGLL